MSHGWRPSPGADSSSVGDDELVDAPVFVAPVGQVAANDDGDLPGPVTGGRSRYMGADPGSAAEGQQAQKAREEKP